MKNYIVEAYKLGRQAALVKSAKDSIGDYLTQDHINRMLGGAGVGAIGGTLIGGKYNRLGGALGGAITGIIASNPQLLINLLHSGTSALYNVFNKK